jgi:RimJ/RimL family protein N-acetyltransferase
VTPLSPGEEELVVRFELPIETDRLVLRPHVNEDFEALYAMHRDPEVMRHAGGVVPWEREYARGHFHAVVHLWSNFVWGAPTVTLRETGEFIGWCGLTPEPHLGDIQLGYRFVRHAWGQGYATEAGRAMLAAGFVQAGLDRIVATTLPENAASVRVLEKLGFGRTGDLYHRKACRNVPVYAITRAERS